MNNEDKFQERSPENVLKGLRIAVLVSDGFDQNEFDGPIYELQNAGATVDSVALNKKQLIHGIRAFQQMEQGKLVRPDKTVLDIAPDSYHGLFIPGGALSADAIRESLPHLSLVRNFMDSEKPVGVICHGGWVLADAGVIAGKTMTSWPAIRKDLERAGAIWYDKEVVEDGNLISSRKAEDVPTFSLAFVQALIRYARASSKAA